MCILISNKPCVIIEDNGEVLHVAYTKASMKAVDKYVKNNYDSFLVRVPKGRKATIEEHAKARGESVNGLINRLMREEIGVSEDEWKRTSDEGDA